MTVWQWATMHNNRTLKLQQIIGTQPWYNLSICICAFHIVTIMVSVEVFLDDLNVVLVEDNTVNLFHLWFLYRCFLWRRWVIVWDRSCRRGRGQLRVVPATAAHTFASPSLPVHRHGTADQHSLHTCESTHATPFALTYMTMHAH